MGGMGLRYSVLSSNQKFEASLTGTTVALRRHRPCIKVRVDQITPLKLPMTVLEVLQGVHRLTEIHKSPPDSRRSSLSSSARTNHATTSTLSHSHLRHRARPLHLFPCHLDVHTPEYAQESPFFYRMERV